MKQKREVCITMNNHERNTYVKEHIAAALIELMKYKPIDEITINELTEKAQVGRVSFYRNFRDKDDILRYYIFIQTENWLNSSEISYLPNKRIQEFVVFLLEHMYEYREFFSLLMREGRMHLLEAEFDTRIRTVLKDTADPWRIACTIGGFYKLFCYWAETGYEKSPQEIAEYLK